MAQTLSRNVGFDLLRVGACIGVVMLHACIAYLSTPLPGLAWPVTDDHSPVVETVFWMIQGTIMPIFFCMSGYWAALSLQKTGPATFLKTRISKVLIPLLIAMVIVLPIDLYVWLIGWIVEGRYGWEKLRSLKVSDADRATLYGVAHLWYLQVLFVYGILLGLWGRFCHWAKLSFSHWSQKTSSQLYLVSMLLTFCWGTGVLHWEPKVTLGFLHGWLPPLASILYYLPHFLTGALASRVDMQHWPSRQFAAVLLLFSIPAGFQVCRLAPTYLRTGQDTLHLVSMISLYAVSMTQSLLILARRYSSDQTFWISDLALGTLTIYLFHHPIVGALHIVMSFTNTTSTSKMIVVSMIAFGISYGIDRILVRKTFIGRLLTGQKITQS